jgi:hypothetical protein
MILGEEGRDAVPSPRGSASADQVAGREPSSDLRRMALHLETAAVLESRARRATDPAQEAVLWRRAEQRRREAARIRARLALRGGALGPSSPPR